MLMLLQGVTNINSFRVMLYDLRKHFLTNRVMSLWNSLPDGVMDSDTIKCFKSRLDKFWTNQYVVYNWDAELIGTGNQSLCSLQRFFKFC